MYLMLAARSSLGFGLRLSSDLEDEIGISPAMDEESEIFEGIKDVGDAIGRSSNPYSDEYWPKIKERILKNSASTDIKEAIQEWVSDGHPYISRETCQLCDKVPIKFCFPIKNRMRGTTLVVGCECVFNYLKIDGYTVPRDLERKLKAQLNILDKKSKGKATDDEVVATGESYDILKAIKQRLKFIGTDFRLDEYERELTNAILVANHLGVTDPAIRAAQEILTKVKPVRAVISTVCRGNFTYAKLTKEEGLNLSTLVKFMSDKRKPVLRRDLLDSLLSAMNNLFTAVPSEVIARALDAVNAARQKFVEDLSEKCDLGKAQVLADYRSDLNSIRKFEHLHFMVYYGIETLRKKFDAKLDEASQLITSPGFIQQVHDNPTVVSKILKCSFNPDLSNSTDSVERASYNTIEFVRAVNKGNKATEEVSRAIQEVYPPVGNIRDIVGVKLTLLRSADDSLIDVDALGKGAVQDLVRLILGRDHKVHAILQEEVDEVKTLSLAKVGKKVYQAMGDQLGFDVQKAFKVYSSEKPFEDDFCTDLLDKWEAGNLTTLSPAQMSNIKTQLSFKGRHKELANSMWKKLSSRLSAKARVL